MKIFEDEDGNAYLLMTRGECRSLLRALQLVDADLEEKQVDYNQVVTLMVTDRAGFLRRQQAREWDADDKTKRRML